jgi:hypothetical protein
MRHVAGWVRGKRGLPEPSGRWPASSSRNPVTARPAASETPAAAATARSADEVMAKVTEIVAEMTGYPADLLDPDLDLEADLGVDTVKQAEVFAAVRGALQPRTRRQPEAARLPDDQARRRLGPRQGRHPRADFGGRCPEPGTRRNGCGGGCSTRATGRGPRSIGARATSGRGDGFGPEGHRHRRRHDRLPRRPARPRPRPRSRPRRRHRQASRSLRRRPRAPTTSNATRHLKLRDFPTIKHVAGWVRGKAGLEPAPRRPPAPKRPLPRPRLQARSRPSARPDHLGRASRPIDALPRRIPVPSLRPALDNSASTPASSSTAPASSSCSTRAASGRPVKRLEKAGATVLPDPRKSATEELPAQPGRVAGRRPDRRRLLAAGTRRRRHHDGLDLNWTERCAAASRASTRRCVGCGMPAPSSCRPPAWAATTATTPRARAAHGRRGDRVHQVLQEGDAPTPWSRRSTSRQPQDRRDRRPADRGDAA